MSIQILSRGRLKVSLSVMKDGQESLNRKEFRYFNSNSKRNSNNNHLTRSGQESLNRKEFRYSNSISKSNRSNNNLTRSGFKITVAIFLKFIIRYIFFILQIHSFKAATRECKNCWEWYFEAFLSTLNNFQTSRYIYCSKKR